MGETTVVNIKTGAAHDVYIGRPSPWGNPFHLHGKTTRGEVIARYRQWLMERDQQELVLRMKKELKGKVLGCYCKPLACHGDVIKEIVDAAG